MINKHLTGVLLLLFVVLIPLIVLPEEREMTLEEAINISLKENPSMQKAESYIRQAEEGKNEVRGGLLPRIDVGVNYTRQGNIPVLDLTPYGVDFVQNVSSPDNYKYYVSLTQLLFNYQMLTDYEMAKLNILNMDYQYDITKQSVVYNVSKSYYNVLTGNSLAELTKETVTQYELHLNNSQKLYKQGSVPKYDVLRVDVDLAKAMENDITARNNVELSKASFNNSLGINLSSPVNIKECLKYEPWKIEYKKSLDYALANRPEIKQMDTLLSIAEKKISYAKAEGYPNLTLSSSYYGQNSTLIQQANGWNLVVGASLPIFHGGAINARIKKAEEGL